MNNNVIKVKYLSDIKPLVIEDKGDWIDLRASENYVLIRGEFTVIRLGVAIELPEGYSALIAPRSSSYKKWGFIQTNSIGIIDNSYCGDNDEWMLPVLALRNSVIHKNDRICQFRIIPNCPVQIMTVETLGNPDRNGFGSTGVR